MKHKESVAVSCRLCPLAGRERILVATDGSKYSQRAVDQAVGLAKLCGSSLFALSVVELNPEFAALAPNLVEKMEKESKELLEGIKHKVTKQNVVCETIIHEGEQPYKFIVKEAKRRKAGIIVIGTHGKTGLKKLLMGSVAGDVIGHAPCPVLVIPLKGPVNLKDIVVASDGSEFSKAAVKEAINIATACDSTLTIVCVVKSHRPAKYKSEAAKIVKKARKDAEKANVDAEAIVREGESYEVIIDVVREKRAGAIVMGSHGRTGLERLLMGSVTERVIGHAPCAVLVVPKAEETSKETRHIHSPPHTEGGSFDILP